MQEAVSISENTVTLGDANVTDNSLAAYVSNDAPEYFALGNTTVTWTATDDSENTVSEVQNVLIVDTISSSRCAKPTILVPADLVDAPELLHQ